MEKTWSPEDWESPAQHLHCLKEDSMVMSRCTAQPTQGGENGRGRREEEAFFGEA